MLWAGQGDFGSRKLLWLDRSLESSLPPLPHGFDPARSRGGMEGAMVMAFFCHYDTSVQTIARSVANVLSPLSLHLTYRVVPHTMEVSPPSFNLHVNTEAITQYIPSPKGDPTKDLQVSVLSMHGMVQQALLEAPTPTA